MISIPESSASSLHSAARDRDLERRVATFLGGRHLPALRQLRVTAVDGRVTLTGRLSTFYEKQVAQVCVRRVAGVVAVMDQTCVDWRDVRLGGDFRRSAAGIAAQ